MAKGKGTLGLIRTSQIHSVRLTEGKIQGRYGHDHHAPTPPISHHNNHEHAQYRRLNEQEFLSMRD